MREVLVIDNIDLWLSLNRHFAGRGYVRVSEASSLELGIRLAQVHRPDLIVCSGDAAGHSTAELNRRFKEARLEALPVVCVCSRSGVGAATGAGHPGLRVCSPDDFLASVDRVVGAPRPSETLPRVELLAHFQSVSSSPGEPQRGFVNLLRIDPYELLIESDRLLEIGDCLDLTFYIPPEQDGGSCLKRPKVSARCEIRRCQDEDKLLYRAALRQVGRDCETAFRRFVDKLSAGRDNPG